MDKKLLMVGGIAALGYFMLNKSDNVNSGGYGGNISGAQGSGMAQTPNEGFVLNVPAPTFPALGDAMSTAPATKKEESMSSIPAPQYGSGFVAYSTGSYIPTSSQLKSMETTAAQGLGTAVQGMSIATGSFGGIVYSPAPAEPKKTTSAPTKDYLAVIKPQTSEPAKKDYLAILR